MKTKEPFFPASKVNNVYFVLGVIETAIVSIVTYPFIVADVINILIVAAIIAIMKPVKIFGSKGS